MAWLIQVLCDQPSKMNSFSPLPWMRAHVLDDGFVLFGGECKRLLARSVLWIRHRAPSGRTTSTPQCGFRFDSISHGEPGALCCTRAGHSALCGSSSSGRLNGCVTVARTRNLALQSLANHWSDSEPSNLASEKNSDGGDI